MEQRPGLLSQRRGEPAILCDGHVEGHRWAAADTAKPAGKGGAGGGGFVLSDLRPWTFLAQRARDCAEALRTRQPSPASTLRDSFVLPCV